MQCLAFVEFKGLVEAVLFDKTYKQYGNLFKGYGPYVVKGRVQSCLLPTSRNLHFVSTGGANLLVDAVQVLQLEKKKLETESLALADHAE